MTALYGPVEVTMLTVEQRNLSDKMFSELDQAYPHLVEVGRTFIKEMGKPQFVSPEVNLVQLESLIAGWIYAQPWFANMVDQLPHEPKEIFEVVSDTVLQAATDASAGLEWYPQLEPEEKHTPWYELLTPEQRAEMETLEATAIDKELLGQ
jgi:hypothetical protein